MLKRILLPLDGSKRADQALDFAKALNQATDIELILLEIDRGARYPTLGSSGGETSLAPVFLPDDSSEGPDKRVHHIAEVTRAVVPNTISLAATGDPVRVILETAVQEKIDLIVMASHGYAGFKRLLHGSVTEKVMRQAACPVLAIKNNHIPTHFLIALDGTPESEAVVFPAAALANLFEAEITITHIQPTRKMTSHTDLGNLRDIDPNLSYEIAYANLSGFDTYLSELMEKLEATLDQPVAYKTDYGEPEERLLAVAKRNECDLIAVATHGRRGLRRWLSGSVTESIFRHTKRAMLVVNLS
ncbi:MAG: universal stress protein [Ardenticatenaceae bacterium]|nr:universal stress protein [Ardenticatenaceae bacterium]